MNGCLIASPSQARNSAATAFWGAGVTADPIYPVSNVLTLEPDVPAKVTAAAATVLHASLPAAATLEGFAIINCNFPSREVELTNTGGMAGHTLTVPSPADALCVNAWWDLRGVSGTTAAEWTISIPAPVVPVAIGTILLITAWHKLRVRWDWELREKLPVIMHRTGYGKRLQYQIPTRTRKYRALAIDARDRKELRTLRREAHGSIVPWVLVPDFEDEDVLLVQFVEDEHSETYRIGYGRFDDDTAYGLLEQPIEVEEVNAGVAL